MGAIPLKDIEALRPARSPRREIKEWELLSLIEEPKNVSHGQYEPEEIREDIELMFDIFENFYGAYGMLGGPETFDEAERKIIEKIDRRMNKNEIATIVSKELSVFADAHLDFERRRTYPEEETFMAEDIYVGKKGERFFIMNGEGVYEVSYPEEILPYLRHTINNQGCLSYALVKPIRRGQKFDVPMQIHVKNRLGKEKILPLEWKALHAVYRGFQPVWSEEMKKGVLIQRNARVYDGGSSYESLERLFEEYGKRAKGHSVMILDLRGNIGGQMWFATLWGRAILEGDTSKFLTAGVFRKEYRQFPVFQQMYTEEEMEGLFDGSWRSYGEVGGWAVRPNNILILSDDKVSSAAESFIFNLRQIDKTVIVGIPTAGMICTSNPENFYLPNTGCTFRFSLHLSFHEKISDDSESAIEPDLWVDPALSEEKALKFIEHYKIGKK